MTIAVDERASCTVLGDGLRSGKFAIPQITERALHLVDSLDSTGPELASVLAVNPAASTEAEPLQTKRPGTGTRAAHCTACPCS